MSNIHHSILEKLAALNIDIYHYEDIVRCYVLAKLKVEYDVLSQNAAVADGNKLTVKMDAYKPNLIRLIKK